MKLHTEMKLAFSVVCLTVSAQAEFKMDRAAMSDAYWNVWNDDVQRRIDADIERYRKADATVDVAARADGKVSFRGFRGRYRLTWKVAGEESLARLVEVK